MKEELNKFYTPEPEEFVIGATYYMPIVDDKRNETGEYGALIIDEYLHYTYAFGYYIDNEGVEIMPIPERAVMKHLDAQDIRSCGFGRVGKAAGIPLYMYRCDGWNLNFNTKSRWISITQILAEGRMYSIRFSGTIKNLRELKMILKMIGYERTKSANQH